MPPKTRAVMDTNAAARDAVRQESLTAIAAKASIGIIGGDREGQGGAPAGQSPTTHISVVGAAPLAELPLEPQVVERVLPKFSMSPADFDLLDRAQARFRVASGGEDCHQSRVVVAAIRALSQFSDDRLVELVRDVKMRKPGPKPRGRR